MNDVPKSTGAEIRDLANGASDSLETEMLGIRLTQQDQTRVLTVLHLPISRPNFGLNLTPAFCRVIPYAIQGFIAH